MDIAEPSYARSRNHRQGAVTCLNATEKTVYRLAQRGDLPGFKVAGARRFRSRDIDAWIEDQKQAAHGPAVDA